MDGANACAEAILRAKLGTNVGEFIVRGLGDASLMAELPGHFWVVEGFAQRSVF